MLYKDSTASHANHKPAAAVVLFSRINGFINFNIGLYIFVLHFGMEVSITLKFFFLISRPHASNKMCARKQTTMIIQAYIIFHATYLTGCYTLSNFENIPPPGRCLRKCSRSLVLKSYVQSVVVGFYS